MPNGVTNDDPFARQVCHDEANAGEQFGWQQFLTFAHEAEALTPSEAEVYPARVWNALIEIAHRQSEHQREADPVDRFLGLLRARPFRLVTHISRRATVAYRIIPMNRSATMPGVRR